jgi:Acyl-CoA carboxylase epsilon subunit
MSTPRTEESVPDIEVISGNPTAEELAALAVVLMALAAGRTDDAGEQDGEARLAAATWHRLERVPGFEGPRTWHAGATARRHRIHGRNHPSTAARAVAVRISA